MKLRDIVDDMVVREDDEFWLTYDAAGDLISMHVGAEPEFSDDEGLIQLNVQTLDNLFRSVQTEMLR